MEWNMIGVGIDMAKDSLEYCAMDGDGTIILNGSENNNEPGFTNLLACVKKLKEVDAYVRIGVESTGIYHIPLYAFFLQHGIRVRILNGIETKGLKDSRIRKTKTDKIDSEAIAQYLMISKPRNMPFPTELENLREYVGSWDRIRRKIVTTKNQLERDIDLLLPGFTGSFSLNSKSVRDIISRYMGREEILSADISDLRSMLPEKKVERLMKIAEKAYDSRTRRDSLRFEIGILLETLQFLENKIGMVEDMMREELQRADTPIKSIPGIGDITGSIILSRIGDIRRFDDPDKLVAFAGLDPSVYQSGKTLVESHISKRGDPLLRYALYMSALNGVINNPVLKEFYERKKDRMEGRKLITACARKMCHIVWKVWTSNKTFTPILRNDRENKKEE